MATLLVAEWNAPSHALVKKVVFRERMHIYGGGRRAAATGDA